MSALSRALLEIDAVRSGAVITDRDVLEGYASDESEVTPRVPDALVRARTTAEVAATLRAASAHGVFVTPRASGTGRVGGAVAVQGGIVLSLEGMHEIRGIERVDLLAVVEPGVVTGQLHEAVEARGLFYPPDPNSLATCTLGGNIAAGAGGPRAFKYGVTRDHVLGLELVTGDGTILKLGKRTPKGVTGYDLTALMVGSEGTLGVVTEATLRLRSKPPEVATLLVFLADLEQIQAAIALAISSNITPRCVEMVDAIALELMRRDAGVALPEGARAMLLIELDGQGAALERDVERLGGALDDAGALEVLVAQKAGERERLWAARRELSRTLRKSANFKLSEDVVVPRSRMAELLQLCGRLAEERGIQMPTYGHAGDGNLHVNLLWDDESQRPQVDSAIRALFEAVVEMGGTLSGEHGIGALKAPYLELEQSAELIATQRRVKQVFDPKGILNPGKIFPARRGHGAC
ncbi:MAG: FAD-binding protein [Deltaproteobacteria bacterium]|nr:FAD-binding protein [Deltaproteobacteria bacterium]